MWEQSWMNPSSLQQRCQNFRIFSFFDNSPNFGRSTQIYFIKPEGSALKRVATGSVSKRYQTSLIHNFQKRYLKT